MGRWEDNIRRDLKEISANMRNCLIQLMIGIIGEPLCSIEPLDSINHRVN